MAKEVRAPVTPPPHRDPVSRSPRRAWLRTLVLLGVVVVVLGIALRSMDAAPPVRAPRTPPPPSDPVSTAKRRVWPRTLLLLGVAVWAVLWGAAPGELSLSSSSLLRWPSTMPDH